MAGRGFRRGPIILGSQSRQVVNNGVRLYWWRMMRISISAVAFEAIAATLSFGSVDFEDDLPGLSGQSS